MAISFQEKEQKQKIKKRTCYNKYHDSRPGRNRTFRQLNLSAKELNARILSRRLRGRVSSTSHFLCSETSKQLWSLNCQVQKHINTGYKEAFYPAPQKSLFRFSLSLCKTHENPLDSKVKVPEKKTSNVKHQQSKYYFSKLFIFSIYFLLPFSSTLYIFFITIFLSKDFCFVY